MVSIIAAASAAFAASAQDIKLGYNGDLSASPAAISGQAAVLGIQAAIEDINSAGGVLGRKLVLVVRDDMSMPPKAIQNMSELIDGEKVSAVFGPTNSGNGLAWRHIPNQKKVPVMNVVGGATDLTKPVSAGAENYMFRVSMVDRYQVAALMGYAKKSPGVKNIGLITESNGWGQNGLQDLQQIAELQGLKVVAAERMGSNDTDATSQLSKLKAANVDTVLLWTNGTPTAQIMRSMDKLNYYPRVLSSWAADNSSFYDAAGKNLAEKPIFMRTLSDSLNPKQTKLRDRIGTKLAAPSAITFVMHGYDGTMLLAQAMKQAGSTDGPAVKAALEDLKTPVDGMMKTYNKPFSKTNHEGLVASDLAWIHWKDGKLLPYNDEVVKSITAADLKY
ncbi:ABC transporter substrate-binding protein [Variovorax sp. J22R133]|nr:ABC transporter substrate-binding protein [Variovorax sp. J22R133]